MHIYHILIHTEYNTYQQYVFKSGNIDTTGQGPELQCFLKVK